MVSRRPLTVLQLLPALESGGVERGVLEVSRYLTEQGHRSLVASAGGRLVAQLEREGGEHFNWNLGRKSPLTLTQVFRFRRFLQEQRVDILHARSRMPAWVAWLAWRGMDAASRPAFVTTVHGLYSANAYSGVMTRGERVIAVSECVRQYVLKHYPRVDPARIVVIPRGIDPAAYPPGFRPAPSWLEEWNRQYPHLAGKKLLTLPGRITRLKGHEAFIRLIGRLREQGLPVHGLIVGGAEEKKLPYLEELRAAVARAGLEADLTFTGQRGDLREILAVSDLVYSLSNKPESFGRTVLEALAMGVPVLGYDHGGVGEQLARMFPAGRVPLGDADALVRESRALLDRGRIQPLAPPSTLAAMLSATLDVYLSLSPANTT